MKTTKDLFLAWLAVMDLRWSRLNFDGKIVQRDFGPVKVRMHEGGIAIFPFEDITKHNLPFYEEARLWIKTTLNEARHEASKKAVRIFESELNRDIAEAELSGETEGSP